MPDIFWDINKNYKLKEERGVSFDDIVRAKLLAVMRHPSRTHQNIMLLEYNDYIWVVPYVIHRKGIFLKTLFPSRKYTRMWKRRELR